MKTIVIKLLLYLTIVPLLAFTIWFILAFLMLVFMFGDHLPSPFNEISIIVSLFISFAAVHFLLSSIKK